MINPLFEGRRVRLTGIEADRDALIESSWTHDPEYLRMLSPDIAHPLSPFQVKQAYEELQKENGPFQFMIRLCGDNRLVGFVRLSRIQWAHGIAYVLLGIGSARDRGQGYGTEALELILRYAFAEINLFRLTAVIGGYNKHALHVFERAGFQIEVRRRESLHRDGQRWDELRLGLLREEWESRWQASHSEREVVS